MKCAAANYWSGNLNIHGSSNSNVSFLRLFYLKRKKNEWRKSFSNLWLCTKAFLCILRCLMLFYRCFNVTIAKGNLFIKINNSQRYARRKKNFIQRRKWSLLLLKNINIFCNVSFCFPFSLPKHRTRRLLCRKIDFFCCWKCIE